jgi:galactonate dehydratase
VSREHERQVILSALEIICLRANPRTTLLFVQLHTREGPIGLGEASMAHADGLVARTARSLFDRTLAGRPVDDIGQLIEELRHNLSSWPTVPEATALSGLEQALWDLRGQQIRQPLHALFGGMRRAHVPLYANINRGTRDRSPQGFASHARAAAEDGFSVIKCAPFDGVEPGRLREPPVVRAIELGVHRVTAVREAIGPNVELEVDCHGRFDVETAVDVAQRIAPLRPRWYEEPIRVHPEFPLLDGAPHEPGHTVEPDHYDFAGLAEVARRIQIPLASGEYLFGIQQVRRLMEAHAVRFLMPDVKHCGGLWEAVQIGSLAAAFGVAISPHNPSGPVATLASAHVAAALPSFDLLEYQWGEVEWRISLLDPPERREGSDLVVPQEPGLGARLNPAVVAAHRIPLRD